MTPLPRRVKTAVRLLQGPSDWWLALRTVGWMSILPFLKHILPLPTLVRLMQRPGNGHGRGLDNELRAVAIVRGLCRTSGGNCLERSLILYRVLSQANASPSLVAGMGKTEDFIGHVWVDVDGRPLLESPQTLAPYVEVMRFGPDGLRRPAQDG